MSAPTTFEELLDYCVKCDVECEISNNNFGNFYSYRFRFFCKRNRYGRSRLIDVEELKQHYDVCLQLLKADVEEIITMPEARFLPDEKVEDRRTQNE